MRHKIGEDAEDILGKRANMYKETALSHLGSLELLDFLNKMPQRPTVLMHTACFDHDIISVFNEVIDDRLPKPAPMERFLKTITEALNQ